MATRKHLSLAAKAAVVALFAVAMGVGVQAQIGYTVYTQMTITPSNDTIFSTQDIPPVPDKDEVLIILQEDNVHRYIIAPKPAEPKNWTFDEIREGSTLFDFGYQDLGPGTVEVEHKGPLLIAVEKEEPEF